MHRSEQGVQFVSTLRRIAFERLIEKVLGPIKIEHGIGLISDGIGLYGVAQGMAWLEPHIRSVIETQAMPPFRDVPVEYAHLGDRVGVIGAATLLLTPMGDQ